MASYLILILCLNLDALSFGIAYGLKKQKFTFFFILKISILSAIFFAIPLFFSRFIFKYLNRFVCNIINGVILILLGMSYFIKKSNTSTNLNESMPRKQFFLECLAFSLDAIFTALLGGFPLNFYVFFLIFYFISNFFAIFLGNLIILKINKTIKLRLDYIGGIIFILLGIFKMIGF